MHYFKLTTLVFIFVLYTIFILPISSFAAEVTGKTLRVVLDQTNTTSPIVLSVTLEDNNPERYMLSLLEHFLVVTEENAAGTVLFEGQVKRVKLDQIDVVNTEHRTMYTELPENPLVINLPYFDDASKVTIADEFGIQLLTVDLSQYAIGSTPTPAVRMADCNKCGYCLNQEPPGDLDLCMACLYPNHKDNPTSTLIVDPKFNQPVQPRTGVYYTQLGCIDVGISGFTDSAAAGGVLNAVMTRFVFPITGVLAMLGIIYGSYLLITAQGSTEQLSRGRRWIFGSLIGVIFTFMAILLIRIIAGDILRIPGFDI